MTKKKRAVTLPDEYRVTVRLGAELQADLSAFASALGIGMAEAVRRLLFDSHDMMRGAIAGHAQRENQRVFVTFSDESLLVFGELASQIERSRNDWMRLGVNANQLARRANAGDDVSLEAVQELAHAVAEARSQVDKIAMDVASMASNPELLFCVIGGE